MMTRKSRRVFAVMLALSVLGAGGEWTVVAQQAIDCSINGFCVSNSTSNLLGLPQGTLNIVSYQPWDRVVKSPERGGLGCDRSGRAGGTGGHCTALRTTTGCRMPHSTSSAR